jgi:hypothetical protein
MFAFTVLRCTRTPVLLIRHMYGSTPVPVTRTDILLIVPRNEAVGRRVRLPIIFSRGSTLKRKTLERFV